jgi:outer membrane protein OmpA-like peptidoglycan-associated protein
MGDEACDKVIAALKGVVGAGVTVGALSDKTAAAVAVANDRATTELASLGSGFGVKDLLFALNDSAVNFASDSAEVPESMEPFLKTAAAALKQLKAGHVLEIAGYTDNTGDAALNVALSQKRAEAVREAFIKYGADPDMLVAKGYGAADPIANNDTAEGRLKNRRIEYHVVKAPTDCERARRLHRLPIASARTVFAIKMAMVIRPTPPGTGVIAPATSAASA